MNMSLMDSSAGASGGKDGKTEQAEREQVGSGGVIGSPHSSSNKGLQVLLIAIFAVFGVAARILLTEWEITMHARLLDATGTGFLLANIVGSFTLGWIKQERDHGLESRRLLLAGLGTGFCGSLTSFSSWMHASSTDIAVAGDFWSGVGTVALTASLSYHAYSAGVHCNRPSGTHASQPTPLPRAAVAGVMAAVGVVLVLVFVVGFGDEHYYYALLLAPLGACMRFGFGAVGNTGFKSDGQRMPYGTLAANILSCVVYALIVKTACVDDKGAGSHTQAPEDLYTCTDNESILVGILIGTCGSLSTVSTLMSELYTYHHTHNKVPRAWAYLAVSLVLALGSMSSMYAGK
jgi:CrcB protein